jgi:hypothetical protein
VDRLARAFELTLLAEAGKFEAVERLRERPLLRYATPLD